jgi:hypothetical protein
VTTIPMLVPLCASALWWAAFVAALATRYADGWLVFLALPLVVTLLWLLASLAWTRPTTAQQKRRSYDDYQ